MVNDGTCSFQIEATDFNPTMNTKLTNPSHALKATSCVPEWELAVAYCACRNQFCDEKRLGFR